MAKVVSSAVGLMFAILVGGLVLSGCMKSSVPESKAGTAVESPQAQPTDPQFPYVKEEIATGLQVPWEMEVAPDGRLFFTERSGSLRVIDQGKLAVEPVFTLDEGLYTKSEAGVLGFTLDPNFSQNHYIYMYYSYEDGSGKPKNRVVRLVEVGSKAKLDKVILDELPGNQTHDGGRVKFGPDGMLYITNGDSGSPSNAQDIKLLSGKIFRIQADGSIPGDNPFPGSPVYSLGHRNPQGLAWHPVTGVLYSSEHGQSAFDEINRIVPGSNYGWPFVEGSEQEIKASDTNKKGPGLLQVPLIHSGGKETWAPSGITFITKGPWTNNLMVANLRGTQVQRVILTPDGKSVQSVESLFKDEFGRIRNVTEGPDGSLYVLTNNRDGRGNPSAQDDRIIRFKPVH